MLTKRIFIDLIFFSGRRGDIYDWRISPSGRFCYVISHLLAWRVLHHVIQCGFCYRSFCRVYNLYSASMINDFFSQWINDQKLLSGRQRNLTLVFFIQTLSIFMKKVAIDDELSLFMLYLLLVHKDIRWQMDVFYQWSLYVLRRTLLINWP